MEMFCADCGCLVDHGVRIIPCDTAECCCFDLPVKLRTLDDIADQIQLAFATKNLDTFGRLLAEDAHWGDDDSPDKCRTRSDVIATLAQLLDEGVDGEIADTFLGPNGVACLLEVRWPDEGGSDAFYQAYQVRDGRITEIQSHDDRASAIAALSN